MSSPLPAPLPLADTETWCMLWSPALQVPPAQGCSYLGHRPLPAPGTVPGTKWALGGNVEGLMVLGVFPSPLPYRAKCLICGKRSSSGNAPS